MPVLAAHLVVAGLAHVGDRHCLELLDRQPRRELRQQPVERRPRQRPERAVLERRVDVEVVRGELEVHDAGSFASRPVLRPALDVQADEQPADDADQRPERADEELLEVHPMAVSCWTSIVRRLHAGSRVSRLSAPATSRGMNRAARAWHDAPMEIHFLGGATTVTGSQFLLVTDQARVLVDCGMFQGGPNEAVRNRVPLGFDPTTLDAILLTHAHLDHCGLIPHVVDKGFGGPIYATGGDVRAGRARPPRLGAPPGGVREARGPLGAEAPGRGGRRRPGGAGGVRGAVELARAGGAADAQPGRGRRARRGDDRVGGDLGGDGGRPTDVGAGFGAGIAQGIPVDHEHDLRRPAAARRSRPRRAALHGTARRAGRSSSSAPIDYGEEIDVAPGIRARFVDAGHILGSAIIQVRVVGLGRRGTD